MAFQDEQKLLKWIDLHWKESPRIYLRPVYTVKEDVSEVLEEVAEFHAAHKVQKNKKPWFLHFQGARGGIGFKVSLEKS